MTVSTGGLLLNVCLIGEGKAAQNQIVALQELHDYYRIVDDFDGADIVSVCTPTTSHYATMMSFMQEKKAIWCEKPFTHSLCHAIEAYKASENLGVPILPISNFRFTSPPNDLVMSINYRRDAAYYSASKWRGTWDGEGGGALFTQGWHVLDALLESEPEIMTVSCSTCTAWHDIEVEDWAHVELTTPSGLTYIREISTAPMDIDDCADPSILGDRHCGLVRQLEDFHLCVTQRSTPYIGAQNALYTMTIITACYWSSIIGRPVQIDEILRDPMNHPAFLGWQSHLARPDTRLATCH